MSLSLSLSLYLSFQCFFGQVMSPHHSDQMSQRSQVSRIAFWCSSINAFVFVIVFVFAFVFVIAFTGASVDSTYHELPEYVWLYMKHLLISRAVQLIPIFGAGGRTGGRGCSKRSTRTLK